MKYTLLPDTISENRLIQRVYRLAVSHDRVCIKWDCLIKDDNDLIIVVRTISKSFSVSSIVGSGTIPQGTNIFVYSRKETADHIERDRKNGGYYYYVFPGKLLEKGEIGIYEQKDGKNYVKGNPVINTASNYVQPEGKLYYQHRFLITFAACLCSLALGWLIHSIVVDLPIPMLANFPRIDYEYFAIAITVIFIICYLIFPSGNWTKRACLRIIRKSKYTEKDILHYTVSGCKEKFSVRLTDSSNNIVIPLYDGEHVSFDSRDIKIKKLSYIEYLYWKYIKNEKD